jgi:hypothetical protein
MAEDIKDKLRKKVSVSYLNKDFEGFRRDLLDYANSYFPDKIKDFSEASVGGLLLDFAAYVGDVTSFYLDHQYAELDINQATENKNIERLLRQAGVEASGPSPATARVTISCQAPAVFSEGQYIPDRKALPVLKRNTTLKALGGITFSLVEDIDFSQQDRFGELLADVALQGVGTDGNPSTFKLTLTGLVVSGVIEQKRVLCGKNLIKFKKISLDSTDITDVLSVIDSAGNKYYEVQSLAQDTVFRSVLNGSPSDSDLVPENLEVIPAPYRYTKQYDLVTRLTTLRFGSGLAESLDGDILPDPSDLSLPLYGKKRFSRFSIDPNSLLKTKTLGVSPVNTTLTITYRRGGGKKHNVSGGAIQSFGDLKLRFPHSPDKSSSDLVRRTLTVNNISPAGGGSPAPTIDELKVHASAFRNMQARSVTKQDLLARIYTMPSNFGRVFRAAISSNPNNPLSSILYVICRNSNGTLTVAPDALKKNLSTYLNEYRLVSDSLDILDTRVINLRVKVDVVVDSNQNSEAISNVLRRSLTDYLQLKHFQIESPLIKSDIMNIAINTRGVLSLNSIEVTNVSGEVSGLKYSSNAFNVAANTKKGLIFPGKGAMFELKYPGIDITINVG